MLRESMGCAFIECVGICHQFFHEFTGWSSILSIPSAFDISEINAECNAGVGEADLRIGDQSSSLGFAGNGGDFIFEGIRSVVFGGCS